MKFSGTMRHYQLLALEAFENDLKTGSKHTNIVAPPGSGKTILGLEMLTRLGGHALVLSPNTAIQNQWMDRSAMFGGRDLVSDDFSSPVACLTYQSMCQFDDPEDALLALAQVQWSQERAKKTGGDAQEVWEDASVWEGAAAKRRNTEISRIQSALRRGIARGKHEDYTIADLLSSAAQERLQALQKHAPKVIILDECHHLLSMWGYVIKLLIDYLPDVHVVGLTATPPDAMTKEEERLYKSLLGPVDFMVPTPAIVKDGYLAPYQELAYFVQPLPSEIRYLQEHEERFKALVQSLYEDGLTGELSLPAWVHQRMTYRNMRDRAKISWKQFQRYHPDLARAGCRYLWTLEEALPKGAVKSEAYTQKPAIEDWIILLEDYAMGCLGPSSLLGAEKRYQEIALALRDLGYLLTRKGIKRAQSETDRMLAYSRAKHHALTTVLQEEHRVRQGALRAVVLTDQELDRSVSNELAGLVDTNSGTARGVLHEIRSEHSHLRPLLVSGRGLRCHPDDANILAYALSTQSGEEVDMVEEDSGLCLLTSKGWKPRIWVGLATKIFTEGYTQLLIGTRAMLAEGWDCPSVNCLVDMTMATTPTAVRQMRGRSLRLDPAQADKLSSNWDIVCLAPELAAGQSDYKRFVRKHNSLYAPTEDGSIEAGPGHVHPLLSPFTPPTVEDIEIVNRAMILRVSSLEDSRKSWRLGESYRGETVRSLVIRKKAVRREEPVSSIALRATPPEYSQGKPAYYGNAPLLASLVPAGMLMQPWILAAGAVITAGATTAMAINNRNVWQEYEDHLPLDLVANAIADALQELDSISFRARLSLSLAPRSDGYLRCYLAYGSPAENEIFTQALEEILDPGSNPPRYLISRRVIDRRGRWAHAKALVTGDIEFKEHWYIVPRDLARNKKRAMIFHRAWTKWLGESGLSFVRDPVGQMAMAEALAQTEDWESRPRSIWR
jgi:superfamily II DNA or RNA helicase